MGCKGGAEIAVEIREKRSSPEVGSGTNCHGSVSVLRDYRHGLLFGAACCKLYIVEVMVCS